MPDDKLKGAKKNSLWPEIVDAESALKSAKLGAIGGGVMIAGLILPLIFFVLSGDPVVFDYETASGFYISQGLQVALAAFLTWRMWAAKGRFASILLLIWVIVEVSLKLASGQLNVGWMIMWFFVILSLIHSVRGHWKLHGIRNSRLSS